MEPPAARSASAEPPERQRAEQAETPKEKAKKSAGPAGIMVGAQIKM